MKQSRQKKLDAFVNTFVAWQDAIEAARKATKAVSKAWEDLGLDEVLYNVGDHRDVPLPPWVEDDDLRDCGVFHNQDVRITPDQWLAALTRHIGGLLAASEEDARRGAAIAKVLEKVSNMYHAGE